MKERAQDRVGVGVFMCVGGSFGGGFFGLVFFWVSVFCSLLFFFVGWRSLSSPPPFLIFSQDTTSRLTRIARLASSSFL